MYVGFNFVGWVTNGGAVALAGEAAAVAAAERLGSICVAQFNRDKPKKRKARPKCTAKDTWEIGRYIDVQSWPIMPGEEKSESSVADAYARQLSKISETPTS
jgi:hypothetical protein